MQNKQLIKKIIKFLNANKIEYAAAIPFSECEAINPHLLDFIPKSAVIFLLPYYVEPEEDRNISTYAIARDYHNCFDWLFVRLYAKLGSVEYRVEGFADKSPINEVEAAAKAGLGIIGENGLLINRRYGSYVFIGEVLTDADCDTYANEIKRCSGCGLCHMRCPSPAECLSAITQKKGELTDAQAELIVDSGCVWGCDICQRVCPHNADVAETPISFFKKERLPKIDADILRSMPDSEFNTRAYSWRGRKTIGRNIELFNKAEKENQK